MHICLAAAAQPIKKIIIYELLLKINVYQQIGHRELQHKNLAEGRNQIRNQTKLVKPKQLWM